MELTQQKEGSTTIVSIKGRLDTTNYSDFDKELSALVSAGEKNILVDCVEMDYISSSGLRVFLVYLKKMKAEGGSLKLSGMQSMIKEVFTISGFTTLFSIYDTREEALAS